MPVRTAAVILCCIGLLSLFSAFESVVAAVDCDPTTYSPAACVSAHEESNVNAAGNMDCARNSAGECVPGSGSGCGSDLGWGIAVPGACQTEPAGSQPHECTEDYGVTLVTLHRWRSRCDDSEGGCGCSVYADSNGPSDNVEVCDCVDVDA